MNDIYIIGSGGHARAVLSIIKILDKWKKISIIDIDFKDQNEEILGVSVSGGLELLEPLNAKEIDIFVAIGDNFLRKGMLNSLSKNGFNMPNMIHDTAIIDEDAIIGEGNFIGANVNIGPGVQIGNGNIINNLANIDHESKIGHWNHLSPSSVICGRVVIKNLTWIGANSTVIDGLEVAEKTIIGAGSVVIKSIMNSGLKYAGVPARKL